MKHNRRKLGFYLGLFFILISIWSILDSYLNMRNYESNYTSRAKGIVTGWVSMGRYNGYFVWWEDSTGIKRCIGNRNNIGIYERGDFLFIKYNPKSPWEAVIDVPQETTIPFNSSIYFFIFSVIVTFIAWPRNKYKDRVISFLRLPPRRFYGPDEL
ncbi:MAG: hypothetical protein L6Q78_14190 [Bacteroidia bacterium]|nr:hypothetical protein [Bacteroidia bacterium]